MTNALPIAFVTFKRCVLETLINGPLPVLVERHADRWSVVLKSPDGETEIHIPPHKEMMTSEEAARGFAKAALQLALDEFEADRLDSADIVGELPPGKWQLVQYGGKIYGFCPDHASIVVEDGEIRALDFKPDTLQ